MKAAIAILPAALASALLAGCAGYGGNSASLSQYRIVPVQRMSGLDNPDVWYQRGRYFQGQRRWAQAEQSFRKALELQPNHAEAHNALGAVFAARGQLVEAEGAFRTALRLAPDQAHIRGNLGRVLLLQGQDEEALVALKDAARIDPGNTAVRTNLAEVSKRLGRESGLAADQVGERRSRVAADKGALPASAIPAAASSAVVVLPAVPVGDGRSPVRRIEPVPSAAPVVLTSVSYGELGAVAPREPLRREEVAFVAARAPSPAVPGAPVARAVPKVVVPSASSAVAPSPAPTRAVRLEVANGNGVEGMARRVRATLRSDGYAPVRTTNQQPYTQKETVVQFRAGFEAAAKQLGERFPAQAPVVYEARIDARADVRIVLGRDLPRQFALMRETGGELGGALQLARVPAGREISPVFE